MPLVQAAEYGPLCGAFIVTDLAERVGGAESLAGIA